MDALVAIFAGVSLIIVIVVSIVLFIQSSKLRNDIEVTLRDVVDQINYANRYAYKFDKVQEDNIKNMDVNIQSLRARLDMLYPNNQQVCIGTTCLDKQDLIDITARLASTTANTENNTANTTNTTNTTTTANTVNTP